FLFFFFTCPATTEIYTLSLHDALPIWLEGPGKSAGQRKECMRRSHGTEVEGHRFHQLTLHAFPSHERFELGSQMRRAAYSVPAKDRKSTRLNSSHVAISYAVFCLKKKK